ncbi:MAG: metallophosphoesterase family protein [Lentisphaerae bacterium]|nr:metallophosphoesterase family protein [Lentisphaerota bacterium]
MKKEDTKFAVLGDIHGNIEALEAVLDDAAERNVNAYVCVGDIVGYNADPSACLEKIRAMDCIVVRGNHDHYCSHDESLDDFHPLAANVIDWTRHQLSDDQIEYLRNLKLSRMVSGFTLVHSTLDMPKKWGYVFDSLEAEANFNYQTTSVCFHGHTHVPVIYEKKGHVTRHEAQNITIALGKKYFINVGSVGQPRDGDPRASYVTYNLRTKEIEFCRVRYDIATTQAKIRKAGLPERLATRLEQGR